MQPVLTADEYGRVDRAHAGDMAEAMDRAGYAVGLAAVRGGAAYGKKVTVLAGPGNNGGDGYVAARYLKERGAHVVVRRLADPKTDLASSAAWRAKSSGVLVEEMGRPVDCDVLVDAVFGGGARRGVPREVRAWMSTSAPVVAVDYPTGIDPDTGKVAEQAFTARETVTFAALKTGHVLGSGPDHCGLVTVADIGIRGGDPSMFIAEDLDALRPKRKRTTHKWSAGAVLVIGGSEGLVGASIFAARSALNFGAGTVYVAGTDVEVVQRAAPDIPAIGMENAFEELHRFDVVVAGPGLAPEDAELSYALLERANKVVLDAGGLTPNSLQAAKSNHASVVLTPHDGEFARVAGVGPGTYAVRALARASEVTVLRKGNPTMISDGGLPILVTSGGPELASIGTGDVLAGMVAALWARGLTPREAATSAAYWHGVAGRSLAASQSVTASGLLDEISRFAW